MGTYHVVGHRLQLALDSLQLVLRHGHPLLVLTQLGPHRRQNLVLNATKDENTSAAVDAAAHTVVSEPDPRTWSAILMSRKLCSMVFSDCSVASTWPPSLVS